MEDITLKNTFVSFTPSFFGQGWETSLVPHIERRDTEYTHRITFSWIPKMLLKMQEGRKRWEVRQWTTAIARLFL